MRELRVGCARAHPSCLEELPAGSHETIDRTIGHRMEKDGDSTFVEPDSDGQRKSALKLNCTYGASPLMGHKTGVNARRLLLNKLLVIIHCGCHDTSLVCAGAGANQPFLRNFWVKNRWRRR